MQDAGAAPTHRTSQGEDSGTDTYSFNLEDWDTFIAQVSDMTYMH